MLEDEIKYLKIQKSKLHQIRKHKNPRLSCELLFMCLYLAEEIHLIGWK